MTADNWTGYVLGAGSIGCLFAAYLQRAGHKPTLILRDKSHCALLQQQGGIMLEHEPRSVCIAIAGVTAATIDQPIAQLLICTKAQQTLTAINSVKSKLAKRPILILLQNGMGVRELLQREIPDAIILHAITTAGAWQRERFHVVQASRGETVIGAATASEQHYADAAANALRCELPIASVADIERRLWLKLAINSVINPLTALHQCRNGELLQLPGIDDTIAQLCSEFAQVAAAEQQIFAQDFLVETVHAVIRDTAANRSSTLQDIRARRRTEIDFINGHIIKRALQHRISCPQQIALLDAVKNREHAFS